MLGHVTEGLPPADAAQFGRLLEVGGADDRSAIGCDLVLGISPKSFLDDDHLHLA